LKITRPFAATLFLAACSITGVDGYNSQADIEKAIILLRLTEPNEMGAVLSSLPPTEKRLQLAKVYPEQMIAIHGLIGSNAKEAAVILIPYLGYTDIPGEAMGFPPPVENLEHTKKVFPAFAALLSLPDSGKALSGYCLNPHNLRKYRVTAFLVLRYTDPTLFKRISSEFSKQMENEDDFCRGFVRGIQYGNFPFWGVFFDPAAPELK
jgi:hypothetical protein